MIDNAITRLRCVIGAAEPEANGNGMSASAAARRYTKFVADAAAEYQRQHLSDRQYHVRDAAGAEAFGVGIHYKSTPTVSKALVFSPFNYDTRADHVGVGYYAVRDLEAAHNIQVLHVQDGEVSGRFSVPVPKIDHVMLREFISNPVEGKRAVVGLRVNAVLTAILSDIARTRAAAGYTNTVTGPVHVYDLNDFHYRGSNFRPGRPA